MHNSHDYYHQLYVMGSSVIETQVVDLKEVALRV